MIKEKTGLQRIVLWIFLSCLLCSCAKNSEAEKKRALEAEALAKTQQWFETHREGAMVSGCDMVLEDRLCSAVKGQYVIRNVHGNNETFYDHTYDYVYDFKNDRMYDSRMSRPLLSAVASFYRNGLGLKEETLNGWNLDLEIPFVVYERNGTETPSYHYSFLVPSEIDETSLDAYAQSLAKSPSGEWTGLVFSGPVYEIEELNPAFLKEYPGIHTILIQGSTYEWELTADQDDKGTITVHVKRTSVLNKEETAWEY